MGSEASDERDAVWVVSRGYNHEFEKGHRAFETQAAAHEWLESEGVDTSELRWYDVPDDHAQVEDPREGEDRVYLRRVVVE